MDAPPPVTNLTAHAKSGVIELSWDPPARSGQSVYIYIVRYRPSGWSAYTVGLPQIETTFRIYCDQAIADYEIVVTAIGNGLASSDRIIHVVPTNADSDDAIDAAKNALAAACDEMDRALARCRRVLAGGSR